METSTSHLIIIEPKKRFHHQWKELWAYRELFYFLAWKDILVRYKQTVIGVAWSVIRPLLSMLILTIIFGRVAKLPSEGVPYAVMVMSATLPWQFFANTLSMGSNSLVNNVNMITKVYFPRIIIPTTALVVSFIDFLISMGLLCLLMAWYSCWPSARILTLPLLLMLASLAALGACYWMSALNVKYRDFRHLVPFIVQFGLYASPVGFSSAIVPNKWRFLYSLNPMVGVIDGFRWALLGGESVLYLPGFSLSVALVLILFISGMWYFNRVERGFADVI